MAKGPDTFTVGRGTAAPQGPRKKTLAGIVGVFVAGLLLTAIPREESGRTVKVDINPTTGAATITHVSGPQYLKAYLDIVGVATACDGLTGPEIRDARRKGTKFTEQQCTDMLEVALIKTAEDEKACAPQLWTPGREYPLFASISLGYNIGTRRFCTSTAAREFRAAHWRAGCEAILMWNRAGGRVVKGLADRRRRERDACIQGA